MAVPKVFRHLTRKKVLTVEWMAGESPSDLFLQAGGFGNEKIHYSQKQQLETKTRLLDLVMLVKNFLFRFSYFHFPLKYLSGV